MEERPPFPKHRKTAVQRMVFYGSSIAFGWGFLADTFCAGGLTDEVGHYKQKNTPHCEGEACAFRQAEPEEFQKSQVFGNNRQNFHNDPPRDEFSALPRTKSLAGFYFNDF
jgi:hypothetical protein